VQSLWARSLPIRCVAVPTEAIVREACRRLDHGVDHWPVADPKAVHLVKSETVFSPGRSSGELLSLESWLEGRESLGARVHCSLGLEDIPC
jgi:hypothetical protein